VLNRDVSGPSKCLPPDQHSTWRAALRPCCTDCALLDFTCSAQASAEHFQQCAEFLLLRYRGLRPFAVTVLPISLARWAAATACAAVQSTVALFRRHAASKMRF